MNEIKNGKLNEIPGFYQNPSGAGGLISILRGVKESDKDLVFLQDVQEQTILIPLGTTVNVSGKHNISKQFIPFCVGVITKGTFLTVSGLQTLEIYQELPYLNADITVSGLSNDDENYYITINNASAFDDYTYTIKIYIYQIQVNQ